MSGGTGRLRPPITKVLASSTAWTRGVDGHGLLTKAASAVRRSCLRERSRPRVASSASRYDEERRSTMMILILDEEVRRVTANHNQTVRVAR
jgi:hypothetical protein